MLEALAHAVLPRRSKPRTGGMIVADRYQHLGELLEAALVQFKSETSHIECDRKRVRWRATYLDFHRAARPLVRWLANRGLTIDDRVAIVMGNQPRWHMAAYATFHRGGVVVPLDYKLTPDEVGALLAHAKPRVLFIEHGLWTRLSSPSYAGPSVEVPLVVVTDTPANASLTSVAGVELARFEDIADAAPESEGAPLEVARRQRGDLACIVYSSGTGGRPKGCMLTHDNYLTQYSALGERFPLTAGDRFFSILPTNHAIDFMCGFVGPLAGGATIVHQRALRPEFIRWAMKEHKVTHMAIVPLLLEAFARTLDEKLEETSTLERGALEALTALNERLTERRAVPALSQRLLKPIHDAFGGSLELLFCGGAFVDPELAERFYRLGLPVVIGYGLTEACTVATVNDLEPFRADSVGRPLPGVDVRITNPNDEGVGEVLIRGRTVMAGYLEDPELTAETLRDGWLHTGDLGVVDASRHLRLVGRVKNMIVTAGGKNVYPEDVESAFEGLDAEELVVTASGYVWGGELVDEILLVVARVEAEHHEAFVRELSARNHRLAEHKRVGGILFWNEEFPRTASMKIKRKELAEALRASSDPSQVRRV
jgi:long-chain acyl-CoA synthetase